MEKTARRRPISGTPLLFERVLRRIPFPYWVTSLIIAVIFGPLAKIFLHWAPTQDWQASVIAFFLPYFVPEKTWQQVVGILLWTSVNFYMVLVIMLVRQEVSKSRNRIIPLLPQGEEQFRTFFRSLHNPFPPLLLFALLILSFYEYDLRGLSVVPTIFGQVWQIISLLIMYFVHAMTIWVFLGSLWGLYRAGCCRPLLLKLYFEDSNLGALPLGQLSLNIARIFFLLLGLFLAIALITPVTVEFLALLAIFAVVGLVMFFLPLNGVHQQMKRARQSHLEKIGRRVFSIFTELELEDTSHSRKEADYSQHTSDRLAKVEALKILEQRAKSVSVWPFDTEIIRHLAAVVLPIVIGIAVGYFMKILNL